MDVECGAGRIIALNYGSTETDFFINTLPKKYKPRGLDRFLGSGPVHEAIGVVKDCVRCVNAPERICDLEYAVVATSKHLVPQTT